MKRLIIVHSLVLSILMLTTGMIAGWWLHSWPGGSGNETFENHPYQIVQWDSDLSNTTPYQTMQPYNDQSIGERSLFLQALDENRIDDALVIYQQYERKGASAFRPFRKDLEDWLNHQDSDLSINVLERFTQHYYQDESLLTRLANRYEHQDRLDSAVTTLLELKSFTDSNKKRSALNERIHSLSRAVYNQQMKLDQLETLLELFQRLSSQEANYGFYRFALSQIYLAAGDSNSAIRELEVLQTHSEFGRQAAQLLAALTPPPPMDEPEELPGSTIPLSSRNGHFIIDVSAGNKETVKLLIDTGASLTTLPSDLLQRLRRKKLAARVGHTQLKTAGGYQFAPIYQLKELHIGNFIVRNLQVAELDLYELGSEGLLGMDVLGQFRFHLDQDRNTLTLHPR